MRRGIGRTAGRIGRAAATLALVIGLCPSFSATDLASADEPPSGSAAMSTTAVGTSGSETAGAEAAGADATSNDATSDATTDDTDQPTDTSATDVSDSDSSAAESAVASLPAAAPALTEQGTGDDSPYGVWISGVAVTETNKDNVLAGTVNDGKVRFIPAENGSTAKLVLGDASGASVSISGAAGLYEGAAISSDNDLIVDVSASTTLAGASCQQGHVAGLYVTGALTLQGTDDLAVTAGDSSDSPTIADNFSAGIFASRAMDISGIPNLTTAGGGGTSVSAGIWTTDKVQLAGSTKLIAQGTRNDGGDSIGINAERLVIGDTAAVEAYGDVASDSLGVYTSLYTSGDDSGITVGDDASLTAQGADATTSSYGIRNISDTVEVTGNAVLQATSGTVAGDEGVSRGISGQLVYDGGSGNADHVTASCGTAPTSYRALDEMPLLIDGYRWQTDTQTEWRNGATDPYAYSGTELMVAFAPADFDLWVGGTQVTMANKDDVLGDGTVAFTPATAGSGLGRLELTDASISGVADTRLGAGIYTTGSLQVILSGTNTINGATVADGNNVGMCAHNLTIGGHGSLDVISADAASGGHGTALDVEDVTDNDLGDLVIQNTATVSATALEGVGIGVLADNLTLADTVGTASLIATGGSSSESAPVAASYGILCYGQIELKGSNRIAGIGCAASTRSFGISCSSANVSGNDDALLEAVGDTVTATDSISYGIECYDGTLAVTGGSVILESGTSPHTSSACNVAPDLSGYSATYRWRTAAHDAWSYSAIIPYSYDAAQDFLQVTPPMGDLWVDGVQVTTDNMDDILGDGTAIFTPAGSPLPAGSTQADDDTALQPQLSDNYGTLTLHDATIGGEDNEHDGAAVYSDQPLFVQTLGNNTATGASVGNGDAYGIEIPGAALFIGTGSLSVEGGYAGGGNAAGIYCDSLTDGLSGFVAVVDSVTLDCAGGAVAQSGTEQSNSCFGIWCKDALTVAGDATLRASGEHGESAATPLSSIGIAATDMTVSNDSTVYANGKPGKGSFGVLLSGSLSLEDTGRIMATAYDGSERCFGIYAPSGTMTLTGGQLTAEATADASGATIRALSQAPTNELTAYHWRTAQDAVFTLYPSTPYIYDASQTYVQIGSAYDLKVGGVRVTDANRDNVLAGTANDGKVSFTAGGEEGTFGTLRLDSADISGADGIDLGAGIYSELPGLTIDLAGANTVKGGAGSEANALACGIDARSVVIRGTGSLDVTAGDMPQSSGNRSYGIQAAVTMIGDATTSFTGGTADASAGLDGSLVMKDRSHLTCAGGAGATTSIGAKLLGLKMGGQAQLTATGDTAPTSAGVSQAGAQAIIADESSLTATGGTASAASYGFWDRGVGSPLIEGDASVTLHASRATTRSATNVALDLAGHNPYRWRSTTLGGWTNGTVTPYAFSATATDLSVAREDAYPLWIGGVQVTEENKDNVLAGTANDGKVVFVPSDDGQSGTLYLDGIDVVGVGGVHRGAGLYSEIPLDVQLSEDNLVAGAAGTVTEMSSTAPGALATDATTDALSAASDGTASDGLTPQKEVVTVAQGLFSECDLDFHGAGTLGVTSPDAAMSVALECAGENLSAGDTVKITCKAGRGEFASLGALVDQSADIHDSASLVGQASEAGIDADGIVCTKMLVRDGATVEGTGATSTGTSEECTSVGIYTNALTVEDGLVIGSATTAPSSYGIDTMAQGDTITITGGTVIGTTDTASSQTVRAFYQAPDVSGYDGYKWRVSSTGEYTFGDYAYSASDTYEEITPGVAPAPSPAKPVAPTVLPKTGDPMAPWALAGLLIAVIAGALFIGLGRRRA